ncbi:tetratricopeptide repeat protein [Allokutzneria sp. A3M-2-11 16]|uniref:AfsR/SARP family transcriptional regulator n=1 Tax=Allokutzneria sp. A3M-2-11 16 TaxID=2962043 RepID=UPI0020B6B581|nr:BTAD domain-containing putative transcriptional regulator [Allokutzneria sp. A3M-2-11 16]MCP3797642.1 tetratricopeptide repeat protein [Allokutzneria sp. A3M-2-11 16]
MIRFGVLGPLQVTSAGGAPVPLRSAHQRTLLAVLLFNAGRRVRTDQLVDAVWEGAPPASYVSNLHTYFSRLRERLAGVRLEHSDGRYGLFLGTAELDLIEFTEALRAARAGAAEDPATAQHYREALGLWRERPLADLRVPALEPQIAALEEERLAALEGLADAELASGAQGGLVARTRALVVEHPLRERFRAQHITALWRAGRRDDALAAYHEARTVLIDELGVEPGSELRELHEAVLRGEAPASAPVVVRAATPICQLPPEIADFTGRAEAVADLVALLSEARPTVPLAVVTGNPGTGKTALAVHVAHRLRTAFPDGQLFAHLAGASGRPRDPGDVLAELLRTLGVAGPALPEDVHARSAAFRAKVADRRLLVVLDDAEKPAQIGPLLPGTPGCAVIVTSRSRLSGLPGAFSVPVGALTDAEAIALLEGVVGPERVRAEPAAADRITASCDNLPLALRIAGTRLASRPYLRLGVLADRLDDESRRLDELAVSDLAVRASVELSYRALSPLARKAFRLLGSFGDGGRAEWSLAALLDTEDAAGATEELVEANLLQPLGQDATGEPRYRLHDLLAVYAGERARDEEDDDAVLAAFRRVLVTALGLVDEAVRGTPRYSLTPRLATPVPPPSLPRADIDRLLADPVAWLVAERANLVALVRTACHDARADLLDLAVQLAIRLHPFQWGEKHWDDLARVQGAVRDAALAAGDTRTTTIAEHLLAMLDAGRGYYAKASAVFQRCGEVFEELGDQHAAACARATNAYLLMEQGAEEDAVKHVTWAREVFHASGDRNDEIEALRTLAAGLLRLGRIEDSREVTQDALALARQTGEVRVIAPVLHALGQIQITVGDLPSADAAYRESLAGYQELGDRGPVAIMLRELALVCARLGRRAEAVDLLGASARMAEELSEHRLSAITERDLAAAMIGDGRLDEAVAALRRCSETFAEMGLVRQRVATLRLLAVGHEARGEQAAADAVRAEADREGGPADRMAESMMAAALALAGAPAG